MITTLLTTTQKAVKAAYIPASKLPKHLKNLPILHTIRMDTHEGRVRLTTVFHNNETGELDAVCEYIPARIDAEFETCIPARAFKDWITASQLTKEEKAKGMSEQVNFTFDPAGQLLTVNQGNSRATFRCISADEFPAIPPTYFEKKG